MVRAFVVYEGEIDEQRFEQHAQLCRKVEGGVFRHGHVFGAPMGEPPLQVLRRVGVPRQGGLQGGARTPEFMDTGRDAMAMGIPMVVSFADISE